MIGRKYKARLVGQHLKQGLKKPVADLLDKKIGQSKADACSNKRIDKTASQFCQMLCQHLFFKVFHTSRPMGQRVKIDSYTFQE